MEARRAGKRKQAPDAAPTEQNRILTRSAAKRARVEPVPPLEKERPRKAAASTADQAVARAPRSRTARRAAQPAPIPAEASLAASPSVNRSDAKVAEQQQGSEMDREPARRPGKAEEGDGNGGRDEEVRPLCLGCDQLNALWSAAATLLLACRHGRKSSALANALSVFFRLSAVCLSVPSLCAGEAGSRGLRTPVCVNEQVHSCPCTDAPVGATRSLL